jgi:hypothetical protein
VHALRLGLGHPLVAKQDRPEPFGVAVGGGAGGVAVVPGGEHDALPHARDAGTSFLQALRQTDVAERLTAVEDALNAWPWRSCACGLRAAASQAVLVARSRRRSSFIHRVILWSTARVWERPATLFVSDRGLRLIRTRGSAADPTVVWPVPRKRATDCTVAASIHAINRGVASTGTSPLPTAAAVSASVTS